MAVTPWRAILASTTAVLTIAAVGAGCGGSSENAASGGSAGTGGMGNAGGRAGHGGRPGAGGGTTGPGGAIGTAGASGLGGHPLGMGGRSGLGGASGAAGSAGCLVVIQAVSPVPVGNTIEAGPRVKLQMRATSNSSVSLPTWAWTVTEIRDLDGQTLHPQVNGLDEAQSIVELGVPDLGSYDIRAAVVEEGGRCTGHTTFVGIPPGPPAYVFRATAAGLPVQEVRVPITPSTVAATLTLDPGRSYPIRPHGLDASVLLPAYVRITSPVTPSMFEGDTSHGIVAAWLLPKINYDLLLVPADQTYAPQLVNALPGGWALDIDQGIPVTGSALAPDGRPLEDARLVLRHDQRPSTVGISGTAGTFQLWTRSGSLSVVATPPLDAGLPQASVDITPSNPGLMLPAGTPSATVTVRWNAVTQGALSLGIRGPDGITPIADARVRASSNAWIAPPPATITASVSGAADITLPAAGTVEQEAFSDATGQVVFPKLPIGTYTVAVTPPMTAAEAAVTTQSVIVPAAGASLTLTLLQKVPLTGTLTSPSGAAGARVTALDHGLGLHGATVVGAVDESGRFALLVDPNRAYQLVIDPLPGRSVARTVVNALAVGPVGTDAGPVALAPGRAITGMVTTGTAGVADALIQVFCEASAASCVDPKQSLAEAISRGDGSFGLVIPIPD